jgi:hypothetical protein
VPFAAGDTVTVREVWAGHVWLEFSELVQVLAPAPVVTDMLDRDDRWWAPWDEWSPVEG